MKLNLKAIMAIIVITALWWLIILAIKMFCFSSPSSEAGQAEESLAGFCNNTFSPNSGVRLRMRGFPPVHRSSGLHKNQPGTIPDGLFHELGGVDNNASSAESALSIIKEAAERNGIKFGSDNWFILLAIRKAENGRDGLQFGIMNPKANNLDKQAGWAAATIVRNRGRWQEAGRPDDFLKYLSSYKIPLTANSKKRNV